jgi:hypothetical protein
VVWEDGGGNPASYPIQVSVPLAHSFRLATGGVFAESGWAGSEAVVCFIGAAGGVLTYCDELTSLKDP